MKFEKNAITAVVAAVAVVVVVVTNIGVVDGRPDVVYKPMPKDPSERFVHHI